MMERLLMPSYGISEAGGIVVRWLKAVGDRVRRGEPLVEVETEKTVTELESPADGTILEIAVAEGGQVDVGGLLAVIGDPEDQTETTGVPEVGLGHDAVGPKSAVEGAAGPALVEPVSTADAWIGADAESPHGCQTVLGAKEPRPVRAAPAARRLAARHGIDLHAVRGSGPYGRILIRDVEAALAARESSPQDAAGKATEHARAGGYPAGPSGTPGVMGIRSRVESASNQRRLVAQRLGESAREVPHFFLTATVTAEGLLATRERLAERGGRVSVTALLLPRIAEAIRSYPALNASWRDGSIEYYEDINVGVAVDTPRGLLVPVIRHVDRKVPTEIHTELQTLAEQARGGTLSPDRLVGGTFTVTNLGMWRVDQFTPIINPPQAAILAVGRISQRPVVRDGFLGVAAQMTLTLAVDHRVADGADAARFLDRLCQLLEASWP